MGSPSKLGLSEKGKIRKRGKSPNYEKILETSLITADSNSAFKHNVLIVWENLYTLNQCVLSLISCLYHLKGYFE